MKKRGKFTLSQRVYNSQFFLIAIAKTIDTTIGKTFKTAILQYIFSSPFLLFFWGASPYRKEIQGVKDFSFMDTPSPGYLGRMLIISFFRENISFMETFTRRIFYFLGAPQFEHL